MNSGPGRAVGIQVSVDVELFLVGVLVGVIRVSVDVELFLVGVMGLFSIS